MGVFGHGPLEQRTATNYANYAFKGLLWDPPLTLCQGLAVSRFRGVTPCLSIYRRSPNSEGRVQTLEFSLPTDFGRVASGSRGLVQLHWTPKVFQSCRLRMLMPSESTYNRKHHKCRNIGFVSSNRVLDIRLTETWHFAQGSKRFEMPQRLSV